MSPFQDGSRHPAHASAGWLGDPHRFKPKTQRSGACAAAGLLVFLLTFAARADLLTCEQKLLKGDYAGCLAEADKAIEEGLYHEGWRSLKIRGHMASGQYEQAVETLESALRRYATSIRLRLLGHHVYQTVGQREQATLMLAQINELASARPWWYTDAADLVTQGRAALLMGADPRQVLSIIYDRVRKDAPGNRDVYLAAGDLALDKHDYAEAAKAYNEGVKRFTDDADLWFGVARAYAPSDDEKTTLAIRKTLELNPRHVPALLMRVDNLIDGEHYDDADELLNEVLAINPQHADAWAYKSVLAHLRHWEELEELARARALHYWSANPRVHHLIGLKLSQKYRFAEGAQRQREALKADANHLPAKMQLAQDLLRLGELDEGWTLAKEVLDKDAYNVVAFNLATLHDNVAKFKTLEDKHFIVRMDAKEANIYGDRVLALLNQARDALTTKYGLTLDDRTTVEIFPQQKDFAIRTFGLPGGSGYLGVCFGKVITANSPATIKGAASWEAVLWHEFCHVVTLSATRNRMPRWLSEGISVYEERQANPTWGQPMSPMYRKLILDGKLTPVGQLSAAFLRAPSPMHLQFAYFESSLVVEFLIGKAGLPALRQVLADLHDGVYINAALEKRIGPVKQIEAEFEAFAKERAMQLAEGADFAELPEGVRRGGPGLQAFLKEHPNHIVALVLQGGDLLSQKRWEEAKAPLRRAIELYPQDDSADGPALMLAAAHRALKEFDDELAVLEKFAQYNGDDAPVFERLAELAVEKKDWPAARKWGQRVLSINPLSPSPWRVLAQAADYENDHPAAVLACRKLLLLEPDDPAMVHYNLARHLHATNDPAAKRHVLMALEEAPRFRDAQKLLLQMTNADEANAPKVGK